MKWIRDRNPESPGMYATRFKPFCEFHNFFFVYFDGEGWTYVGDEAFPYRDIKEWAVIDWGEDGK